MQTESYRAKTFTVSDPDARIRTATNLLAFVTNAAGGFDVIPKGSTVRIDEIKVVAMSSVDSTIFGRASRIDGTPIGWTSTRNLAGKFVNETLGDVPPAKGATKYGINAAWSGGEFTGQKTLVKIVDATLEIEHIALDTLAAYQALCAAAAADGVDVSIKSGFRSYPEQKQLYDGYVHHLPGYNLAAKPGTSKHQNGVAFDIAVAGGDGNPTYDWLKKHAPAKGFVRTVNKEPWHWEYDQAKAAKAVANRTFKMPSVKV